MWKIYNVVLNDLKNVNSGKLYVAQFLVLYKQLAVRCTVLLVLYKQLVVRCTVLVLYKQLVARCTVLVIYTTGCTLYSSCALLTACCTLYSLSYICIFKSKFTSQAIEYIFNVLS